MDSSVPFGNVAGNGGKVVIRVFASDNEAVIGQHTNNEMWLCSTSSIMFEPACAGESKLTKRYGLLYALEASGIARGFIYTPVCGVPKR